MLQIGPASEWQPFKLRHGGLRIKMQIIRQSRSCFAMAGKLRVGSDQVNVPKIPVAITADRLLCPICRSLIITIEIVAKCQSGISEKDTWVQRIRSQRNFISFNTFGWLTDIA